MEKNTNNITHAVDFLGVCCFAALRNVCKTAYYMSDLFVFLISNWKGDNRSNLIVYFMPIHIVVMVKDGNRREFKGFWFTIRNYYITLEEEPTFNNLFKKAFILI